MKPALLQDVLLLKAERQVELSLFQLHQQALNRISNERRLRHSPITVYSSQFCGLLRGKVHGKWDAGSSPLSADTFLDGERSIDQDTKNLLKIIYMYCQFITLTLVSSPG